MYCCADDTSPLPQADVLNASSDQLQQQGISATALDPSSRWTTEDFVIGKIPEDPPPFELCH